MGVSLMMPKHLLAENTAESDSEILDKLQDCKSKPTTVYTFRNFVKIAFTFDHCEI